MAKQLQRVGDSNSGGGTIQSTPQNSVFANGVLVAVHGSRGSGHAHGQNQHQHDQNIWSTRAGSANVRIDCFGVSLSGNTDTCGHTRLGGSPDIFIGEETATMACQTSNISYVSPEGVTALYTPAAQQTMGTESPTPGQISANTPPGAIMQDKTMPPQPPQNPLATCDEFTETTPDSVQLSPNFTLAQVSSAAVVSSYETVDLLGLTRPQIICNLKQMCLQVAEPTLAHIQSLGHNRLTVTSGFRTLADGSSTGSHHHNGAALDMQVLDMTPTEMFALVQWVSTTLPCDQVIIEGIGASHYWIHASMSLMGTQPVAASARLLTQTGQNSYAQGLFLINYNGSLTS